MALPLTEISAFLDPENISTTNLQRQLAHDLKEAYGADVTLGFSFPASGDVEHVLIYKTVTDAYEVVTDGARAGDTDRFATVIIFREFSHVSPNIPFATVVIDRVLGVEEAVELELLVRMFIRRSLEAIWRGIRQETVLAKVHSSDLGSFLHRAIIEQKIHSSLSARHATIFVHNGMGKALRLRVTSSPLRSRRRATEISFDCGETEKRIVQTHLGSRALFEYDASSNLPMDGVSHELDPEGAWSRVYWPVKLSQATQMRLRRVPDHPNDGVIRLTNFQGMNGERLPATWIHLTCVEFFAEALFNIVDAFAAADEASFKKDEAFHNSMSVVDTIIKNIDTVLDTISDPSRPRQELRPPRFNLTALPDNHHVKADRIFQLLRTAYASAKDIGFQISRANDEVPFDTHETTDALVRDVLMRALELVPDMCVAHSALKGSSTPQITNMLGKDGRLPPPVRGSPEALVSVFANLFENCVKYRQPDTKVTISVRIQEEASHVLVIVRDRGVGIKEGDESRIFNRGYRGPNAHEFAPRGSGLGLSWSTSVVEAFQGSISALRSDPGLEITVRLAKA